MSTLDLSKEFKGIYKAGITPELIEVPDGNFLMIDGKGSPDSIEYAEAMQALYGVAYTLITSLYLWTSKLWRLRGYGG